MPGKRSITALCLSVAIAIPLASQALSGSTGSSSGMVASVSDKQQLAVFALGWYGWSIPAEALGGVDSEVMRVFADMKRFEVIGYTQRMGTADVSRFVNDIRKAKEETFEIPEKYLLGEAFLTEAEFNRLVGAFYIVVPVVTNYENEWKTDKEGNGRYQCSLSVSFTFMDVARGRVMAAPVITLSGSNKDSSIKAAKAAIDSLGSSLEYQARKVFPLDSKIVSVRGNEVRMRLGAKMGIKKGTEFSIIAKDEYEGVVDEREAGLVMVKNATAEFSNAVVLYSDIKIGPETQLREIPRLGGESMVYYRGVLDGNRGLISVLGLKATSTEGFFATRPFLGIELPLDLMAFTDTTTVLPISLYLGGDANVYLGRLQASLLGAVGAIITVVDGIPTQESFVSHVGGFAGASVSFLATRDFKILAQVQYDYWLGLDLFMPGWSGPGASLGLVFKF